MSITSSSYTVTPSVSASLIIMSTLNFIPNEKQDIFFDIGRTSKILMKDFDDEFSSGNSESEKKLYFYKLGLKIFGSENSELKKKRKFGSENLELEKKHSALEIETET
ncbi:hypothetical protein C1645_826970 [Glomus cerebriforme]|uniref:Uncharacterized protein n=1 Tax=Glomus cerebriforme TaxID=658196 RepID=A0A397SW12_9GLOM|nr:hypothetical protein C1645_826970 [Glomus cerebriforme]